MKNLKELYIQFKHISLVSVGNVFNAGLGFIFYTAVAKEIGFGDFGIYALLTSLLVFLTKISDFGLNSVYVSTTAQQDTNITKDFLFLRGIITGIASVVGIGVLVYYNLHTVFTVLTLIAGTIFYLFNGVLFAFFQKEERFLEAVGLNTLPALIKGTVGTLALFGAINLTLQSAFSIFAFSISSSLLLLIVFPKKILTSLVAEILLKANLPLLIKAVPAGLSSIISNWAFVSNILVKHIAGYKDVGVFSLSGKISEIFSLLALSIFTVLLPKNAKRKNMNIAYDVQETLVISGLLLLSASILSIFSKYFIRFVFSTEAVEINSILSYLIFASAFTAITSFSDNFFFVEGKTQYILRIAALKLGIYIILSLTLTPSLYVKGIAVGFFAASAVAMILNLTYIFKQSKILS